ncbi:Up-regulated during septation-domain-containing protein [Colletotrichum navitas]|uniref:Up-regulated during septation-domain-containing protein n=1 Tax=Colletotrichum navitas TaxID=681940 RepID=A0AAD8Q0S1_9PEZI|nr:Up-regulated during septation-domain-containing protein [Colletotrichum navitas]KAK1593305.1 Up-regulated during septation-domain-containing protein [Colletotrichum navitas]
MHQTEGRKYQLFPKDRPQRPAAKVLDPEQAFALAMGQNEKTEKPCGTSGSLRLRIKEHNLIRRRKVSIPELGPMTTVQEVPMDSPTIPGRPPLHERSASAPGHHLKQHKSNSSFTSTATADANIPAYVTPACSPERHQRSTSESQTPRPLASPKQLAPLVIPTHIGNVPSLTKQMSNGRMRSGSSGYDTAQLSARTDDSPRSQSRTPYTPLTASTALTTPLSACHSIQSATTPASAPIMEGRDSPMPWENNSTPTATVSASCNNDASSGPETAHAFRPFLNAHKRGQSESGSIMDRGRPRKRSDARNNNSPLKRSCSTRNKSAERRAFEELPTGWRADEAASHMEQDELAALQTQAFGQASRFEVLRKEDVEALSKELRQLDERTEYLRRTYNSLRAGRRNLHSRMCQYLRSPRTARFSTDSMLKQEEALAELDMSIDDWVNKLEQAENRRTRVRQKLLEHVAAAAILSTPAAAAASESLQLAMGLRSPSVGNISTPPRSPAKNVFSSQIVNSPPSPQRVVAQIPSTIIEQPLVEETPEAPVNKKHETTLSHRRTGMESIRIYADSDVYALLADVENEITKMSVEAANLPENTAALSDDERKDIYRARSHEALSGLSPDLKSTVSSPAAPSPPAKDSPTDGGAFFLTNAVFRG